MESQRIRGARQRAKRGTSCIACRQMKLRCDSGDRFPAACTRCARVGRACSLDPGFKRATKNDRLEQLEKRIGEMSEAAKPTPGTASTSSTNPDRSHSAGEGLENDEIPDIEARVLEDVEITPAEFLSLVDLYYLHYHPQLPFLPPKTLLVKSCNECALLFWAIVSVTCKNSERHGHLHLKLAWPLRRYTMETAVQEAMSLHQIQALLLMCAWPLPLASMIDDPTWTFCGIATHMALQFGLHRPCHSSEFVHGPQGTANDGCGEEYKDSRKNTWLACFILNHELSLRNGIPSTVRPDHTIYKAMGEQDDSTPPVLRDLVEITHKDYSIAMILGHSEASSDGLHPDPLPLIRAYDQELDILQARLERNWTRTVEMCFLGTRSRLYSYALSAPLKKSKDRYQLTPGPYPEATNCTSKLYSASMRIIHVATKQGQPDDDDGSLDDAVDPTADQAACRYWTCLDHQNLHHAVLLLLHITRRRRHTSDATESQEAVRRAWSLIRSSVAAEGDRSAELCAVIERVVAGAEWPDAAVATPLPEIPELGVHARMGANAVFDLVLWANSRSPGGRVRHPAQLRTEGRLARTNAADPSRAVAAPAAAGCASESEAPAVEAVGLGEEREASGAMMLEEAMMDIPFMGGFGIPQNMVNFVWPDWDSNGFQNAYPGS